MRRSPIAIAAKGEPSSLNFLELSSAGMISVSLAGIGVKDNSLSILLYMLACSMGVQ